VLELPKDWSSTQKGLLVMPNPRPQPKIGAVSRSGFSIAVSAAAMLVIAGQTMALAADPQPADARPTKKADTQTEKDSSLVQRGPVTPARDQDQPGPQNRGAGPAVFPDEFRTIDGWGNNPLNPAFGTPGMPMLRKEITAYDDGVGGLPARSDGPSPRLVSNLIVAQPGDLPNPAGASDFLWQWGQFLDHDIDETPVASPAIEMDIPVPAGDIWFDPDNTGTQVIGFDRSAYTMVEGVRQQMNNITAFIDGSAVYGSDDARASELRTNDGTGMLKTSAGDLLPFNINGFHNAPTDHDPSFFLAGDIRANEQIALTAMHTLFVREHNHHAQRIRNEHPGFSGDEVFEHARAIVAAEIQAITYNEFVPLLLGPNAVPPYQGYRPETDAGISNAFATAAYRVGHTMLSPTLRRLDASNNPIDAGHVALANGFFTPQHIIDEGIDPILRGLASQHAQTIDVHIIDDVRNFLFGPPGAGGFDLAALNIQRGRDHGVPGINDIRVAYGLPPHQGFASLTPDPALRAQLESLYTSVNEIDPWVAMLAEPHAPGALVGPTLRKVLGEQFTRLRDGDRFWYQSYLPPHMRQMVEQQTLARVIRRNTDIGNELPDDVFRVQADCIADLDENGLLDLADVQAFIAAFGNAQPAADMDGNGIFDLADVQGFIIAFKAGCP
jgi:peroxidase